MPTSEVNRTDSTPSVWRKVTVEESGSVHYEDSTGVAGATLLHTYKSWIRTPNFWALRRSGVVLPENDFFYRKRERSSGTYHFAAGRVEGTSPNQRNVSRAMVLPKSSFHNMPDHGVTLSAYDVKNRLMQQAKTSNFSLPVTLIEGRKTVNMVLETATTLTNVIRDLRRGNLVGAYGALGIETSRSQRQRFDRAYGVNPVSTASRYWLQSQYGWKPLLNDVKNAAEALAEAVSRRGESMCGTVRASARRNVQLYYANHALTSFPKFRANTLVTVKLSHRAVWVYRPRAADLPGLFGLTNPFEVVWEIIPYSFVADWFIPIGGYLSSLDAPLRFEHVRGSIGYRTEETCAYTMLTGEYLDGVLLPCLGGGSHTVTSVEVQREKLNSIPNPSLSDLRFEAKLNATRVTSAIALLWQQASRLSR